MDNSETENPESVASNSRGTVKNKSSAARKNIKSPSANQSSTSVKEETWAQELLMRSQAYHHKFIDSHCHIDLIYDRLKLPSNTQYSEFIKAQAQSYPRNYEGCVAIFCNPQTFDLHNPEDEVLNLASQEQGVWLALGCHPKNAAFFTSTNIEGLRRKLLSLPNVVALGEIGLDYSGEYHMLAETQRRVLISQLELAVELNLPLVIHCRDADEELLEIMQKHVPTHHKIHRHCFTQNLSTAQRWIDAFPNLYVGFTPVITYKSAQDPATAASQLPLDRILLETDAPYFVPGNIKSRKVKTTHPGFALFTAEKIAELRGVSTDEVLEACRNNTRHMYDLDYEAINSIDSGWHLSCNIFPLSSLQGVGGSVVIEPALRFPTFEVLYWSSSLMEGLRA
ncbi:3'-5' ssDNA/RNA exonuclease tatd [Plakobranchus ocellatus]|uniref:3'-5' ssDNA/RNA exonuclease tatd n=1 Tax=Plakobranchus ocellatus TaxID=259542 RepID=A0AAV4DGA6_9GAST|nr:3'-5' ssDNA/RNA exonuclease tatd [Plakobranchus ocellatus]